MKQPTHKFENGETKNIIEFLNIVNYGSSIMYLQAINWSNQKERYKFTKQFYDISFEEFKHWEKVYREK